MNINKATEIQTNFINGKYPGSAEQFKKAVGLGIEALTRIRYQRQKPTVPHRTLLPSETEE